MVAYAHNIEPSVLEKLHLEALPEVTRKAFLKCAETKFFSSGGWYMAGGTALALFAGHRQSVDLDFFTSKKSFDEKMIEEALHSSGQWKTSSLDSGTVYGEFNKAKMSFIAYPSLKISKDFMKAGYVSIASPKDVASMKITAISQRGKKRDFVDLYWISKNVQSLEESIQLVKNCYNIQQNESHILKSLVFFDDAEDDPMPTLFFDTTWEEIKKYFQTEVPRIAEKIIGLG